MRVGRKPAGATIQVDDDWLASRFPNKVNTTSAQLNQARYKIRYNPTIQSQMDRTASTQQRSNNNVTKQYGERVQGIRDWSSKANDLFMKGIQKQKDLDAAAEAARKAAEAAQLAQTGGSGQAFTGSGPSGRTVGPSGKPSGARVGNVGPGGNLGPTSFRSEIINRAKRYLGTPYTLGGGHQPNATSPSRGFNGIWGLDCSGLTGIVFRQMGINLPAIANQQTLYGRRTNIRNARPGDLVGWNRGGHVGIYIGNGQIIHAPRPGRTVEIRNIFRGEAIYAVALSLPGD